MHGLLSNRHGLYDSDLRIIYVHNADLCATSDILNAHVFIIAEKRGGNCLLCLYGSYAPVGTL